MDTQVKILPSGIRTGAAPLVKAFHPKCKELLIRMDNTLEYRPVMYNYYLNKLIIGLVDNNLYHDRFDALVNLRGGIGIGPKTSLLNWIDDNSNALGVSSPNYVAGTGYNTDGTSYIRTQLTHGRITGVPSCYPPFTEKYKRSDASIIIKVGGSFNATLGVILGAAGITGGLDGVNIHRTNCRVNSSGADGIGYGIGWNCINRNNDTTSDNWFNAGGTSDINLVESIQSILNYMGEFYVLRWNYSTGYYVGTTEIAQCYTIGKSLINSQFLKFQELFDQFYLETC